jgi:hypothetical protein
LGIIFCKYHIVPMFLDLWISQHETSNQNAGRIHIVYKVNPNKLKEVGGY